MTRLRQEEGFGLIELMAALTVLLVGIIAAISTLDASRSLVTAAERRSTATARAEREIERLRSIPYTAVTQRAAVTASSDPSTPAFYVPPGTQVVDGVAGIQQQNFNDGRTRGTVNVYVAWVDDACCAGAQDYKRVVVAVKTNNTQSGSRKPLVLTTNIRPRP